MLVYGRELYEPYNYPPPKRGGLAIFDSSLKNLITSITDYFPQFIEQEYRSGNFVNFYDKSPFYRPDDPIISPILYMAERVKWQRDLKNYQYHYQCKNLQITSITLIKEIVTVNTNCYLILTDSQNRIEHHLLEVCFPFKFFLTTKELVVDYDFKNIRYSIDPLPSESAVENSLEHVYLNRRFSFPGKGTSFWLDSWNSIKLASTVFRFNLIPIFERLKEKTPFWLEKVLADKATKLTISDTRERKDAREDVEHFHTHLPAFSDKMIKELNGKDLGEIEFTKVAISYQNEVCKQQGLVIDTAVFEENN